MQALSNRNARGRALALVLSGALAVIGAIPAAAAPDWVVQFGEDYTDEARTVAIDPAGNVLVAGLWDGWDGFIGKYDATGRRLWLRTISAPEGFSDTQANGVAADPSNNVIVAGATSGSLAAPRRGLDDIFVAKHAPSGRIIWRRQFGTDRVDVTTGVAVDRAGNIVIAGYTDGALAGPNVIGDDDGWIARYSPAGTRLWVLQFGSDEDERIEDVAVDASGNILVTGWTFGALAAPNGGGRDAFVAKHAPDGTLLWRRQWRRGNDEVSMGIAADAVGRVFIAGYAIVSNASRAFVASYTAVGDPVWWRQFDARRGARATDIAIDGTGNLYLGGHRVGGLGADDLWMARFDAAGTLASTQSLGGAGTDLGFGVAVDRFGRAYVAGTTWSNLARPPQYYDAFLARFPAD